MAEERIAQHVVTSENRADFMNKRLDIAKPLEKVIEPDAKDKAPSVELKTVEPPKTEEPLKEVEPAPKKEHPIQERFSKMAEQRREAEAKATAERDRAEKAIRELEELKAKGAPTPEPKPEESLGEKPARDKFQNEAEFTEKLVEWSIKKDRIEQATAIEKARIETEEKRVLTNWQERLDQTRDEIEDYDEKIESAKNVMFSNQVRDAILESPIGPRILYYFAEHPAEAEKLKGLSALSAVRSIGRLEADLTPKEKETTSPQEKKGEAHISKAPAPISPLKGASAPENLVDGEGKFKGSFKQYKQLRKEGKLQ